MKILEDKNKGMVIIGDINISKDKLKESFKIFEEKVIDMESVGKEWITIEDNTCGLNYCDDITLSNLNISEHTKSQQLR